MKFPQISNLFNGFKTSKVYKQNPEPTTTLLNKNFKSKEVLHSSLKQLEFITFLEFYLSKRNLDEYSLKFLIELDNLKIKAKKNTIKSLHYYRE